MLDYGEKAEYDSKNKTDKCWDIFVQGFTPNLVYEILFSVTTAQ
jgi:hypothetical protein